MIKCAGIDDVNLFAKMDAPTKMEFDVQMTCGKCVNAVKEAFQDVKGISSLNIDLDKGQVLVEGTLTSEKVKSIIESSGRLAVLKGMGGTRASLGAAVSIMEAGSKAVQGLIRFVQTGPATVVIDGTIDGLDPGKHALCVHECGDLSDGCNSCGDVFGKVEAGMKKAAGDIGDIEVRSDGRAEFRFVSDKLKVWDLIGRSMMVHSCPSNQAHADRDVNSRVKCGIIARSAGLFENSKKICACDGVTQWDERNVPVAGEGRQKQAHL